uniref:Uncharacterized protein n=1 Tax=Rhodnius prolixus TaxID=13249 RepID=T1IDH8_RHOPR
MALANDCLQKAVGPSEPYEFLTVYPHNTVPGHNLQDKINSELSDGDTTYNASVLFKSFPFNSSYPIPVYTPARIERSVRNGLDPCLSLVKQKKAWEHYKDVLLNSCDKSIVEDISSSEEFKEKTRMNVHPNVALLTLHMEKDPDQHFNASYNWYFSGSNIEIINAGDSKFLIRPDGTTGEILFSPLVLQKNQWIPEIEFDAELRFNLKNCGPPCQVDVINNNALIRGKTRICQLMLKEKDEKIAIEQLCDITGSNSNPFISASLNNEKINEFCTLTPGELLIWNVSLTSPVSKLNLNLEQGNFVDSWGHVHYIGADTVLFADRKAIHIFDLRTNNNNKDNLTWPVDNLVEICEEISCCNLDNRGINYVGTNHHLLSLDIRKGWSQRWTHGITSSPTMIKLLHRNLQNLIFVASQRSDSVVLIQNDCEDGDSNISRVHPYLLPSLRESLHLARFNGLCLDHLLNSRFSMSLTGLSCLEDKYINVIRCTSIGDIFWQTLRSSGDDESHNSANLSNDDLKRFEEFEFKCEQDYKNSSQKSRVTSVKNTENLMDSPLLLEPWDIDTLLDESDDSSESAPERSECDSNSDEEYDFENTVSNWLNNYSQEMSAFIEYSIDEEEISAKPKTFITNEDSSTKMENHEAQLSPKEETKISDESSQNVFLNLSSNADDSIFSIQNTTKERLSKPIPTIKKKYVSGF